MVEPEGREEIIEGERIYAAPADAPYATQHFDLGYVLGAHVSPGYLGAVDMLTRTAEDSDYAPDASIYSKELDPVTGGRRLEELAFEVTDEQRMAVPTKKARGIMARGVTSVFCILVQERRVLEWSKETDDWSTLPADGVITDRCLLRPLPVAAILDAVQADEAVARALLERGTAVLDEALAQREARGKTEGRAEGRAEDILAVLAARGIPVSEELRSRVLSTTDLDILDRWIRKAALVASADDLGSS